MAFAIIRSIQGSYLLIQISVILKDPSGQDHIVAWIKDILKDNEDFRSANFTTADIEEEDSDYEKGSTSQ